MYLLRCQDGTLYTGITTNVPRRLAEHAGGGPKSAKYLRGRGPLTLVFSQAVGDHATALRVERWVKRQPKNCKEALIVGQGSLPVMDDRREQRTHLEAS